MAPTLLAMSSGGARVKNPAPANGPVPDSVRTGGRLAVIAANPDGTHATGQDLALLTIADILT